MGHTQEEQKKEIWSIMMSLRLSREQPVCIWHSDHGLWCYGLELKARPSVHVSSVELANG